MLGIGFVLIRMLAQGGMSMVSNTAINLWWVRRRGAVLAIAGMMASLLGSGSFPSLAHALIGQLGWRASYVALGVLVAAVMLPVGLLFYRRQPEAYGLLPDGAKAPPAGRSAAPLADVEENWTRAEALRTSAFWIVSLSGASISMLGTGLHFHMVSIFADAGLSASAAAAAFMPVALASAVFRLAGGVLVDRVPVRYLLSVALVGQTISLLMAPRLQDSTTALVYGIVLGLTGSLQLTVGNVVWAKYYGRRHLGSITGVARLVSNGASALGPMPMGIARDVFGSYTLALTVAAALPLALSVLVLFTQRPHKAQTAPLPG
jgi:MFS family permease